MDEELLLKARKAVEEKLGWGSSASWTNQDFVALSARIQQETGCPISHVTLKRLWGKVKYDALPQTNTLNTLVQFVGYANWREFAVQHEYELMVQAPVPARHGARKRFTALWVAGAALLLVLLLSSRLLFRNVAAVRASDYSLEVKTTLSAGVPNSVIFNFDASKAPADSVVLQQSWDTTLRTIVSKYEQQHTLIYYFPGYFEPRLIVNGKIVQQKGLLLPSNGWVTAYVRPPVPVYFAATDVHRNGQLSLPLAKIKASNIALSPQTPMLSYCRVQDFGPIYSDSFNFETSVRNDFAEGAGACQLTNIYILCEGTAVNIPLCARGCESSINFFFTDYELSGKRRDLSAFGVDFSRFVRVQVQARKHKATVWINNRPAIELDHVLMHSRIIGIDLVFQGTGSVDYVRLSNGTVDFDDEF